MLVILNQFQTYIPKASGEKFDDQIVTGDQLTVERAVNVVASVANGSTPEDRLEGMHFQVGDWHAGVKILTQIFKWYFSGKSEADRCTLYSDRTLINRRNVKANPKEAYRADWDFFLLVVKSRVVVAAMKILGFANKSGEPINLPLPDDIAAQSRESKLTLSLMNWFQKVPFVTSPVKLM